MVVYYDKELITAVKSFAMKTLDESHLEQIGIT